jgi:hypothetical protein
MITYLALAPSRSQTFTMRDLLIGGGHKAPDTEMALRALAHLETLAESWRGRAAQLAG